jgi:hypothetical protein
MGYLMVFIPVFIVVGLWAFSHIRIDKQGKRYWYSQKYEDSKRNRKQDDILKTINESKQQFIDTRKDVLQLQICSADLPDTAKRLAYWAYKKLGHNSWVDQYVVEKGLFSKDEIDYVHNNPEDVK